MAFQGKTRPGVSVGIVFAAMANDSDLGARLRGGLILTAGAALLLYALWPWLPVPGRPARPRTVVFYGFSILG